MALLLAEQALLLALDDATGTQGMTWAGDAGLAAALLLDLGERDLLRVDDGELTAVDGPAPEHPVLRDAYQALRTSDRRHDAKGWVDRLQRDLKPLPERLARGLVERGVLTEQRTKVLGLFPTTRFPQADPEPERELRARLHEVLVTGRAPSEEEALLIGLLEPLDLVGGVVPKEHRRAARTRAQEIGEQGVAGTAVRQAVQEVQAAVITAAVIVPAVTTTLS
ncbi:GOLPH3/VPS74 family protein [Vallicoccus soli]|uniref:GPP34 family phosphoprotein n=1 Tax=Vallicoccus soli TaxID=2339232 RepID=A0A3A3Z419_9ACTN|nr:GPP34 family phosphoprotein [Vallicoccus soli]RJK98172.1 GPP34 family phosphoprotein [Vallicoccus soli]